MTAFDHAFTGPRCWAAVSLRAYADRLGLDDAVLPHLVLASWARIVAGLVTRLEPANGPDRSSFPADRDHVAQTLLQDRDYALWRRAVRRFADLLG